MEINYSITAKAEETVQGINVSLGANLLKKGSPKLFQLHYKGMYKKMLIGGI